MTTKQIEALRASLSSNADVTTTALKFTESIAQAIESGASEEALEEKLSTSWNILISLAAQTDHGSQDPIVEFVKAVQKQKAGSSDRTVTIWGSEVRLWEDMPLLGAGMRSAWNRAPDSGSEDDFSIPEWTNLNAFAARLTASSPAIPTLDYSLYAIWTMRSAFEDETADAAAVEAAKMWFLYAGDVIERLSREGKSFDGPIAKGGQRFGGKAWRGFCEERLAVWKARLGREGY
ncbi:uncharacterized protein RCO7_09519 [Rhynchosporium graminicola]|uniref:Uncharacterized protein n=1 Tax=Rhynchosporium graminicola TaxID=2792576 RepID=A0A1E1K667_9HELO|nr:uncharacterized protein RCO7_09519 [Rhynchosporium commune]